MKRDMLCVEHDGRGILYIRLQEKKRPTAINICRSHKSKKQKQKKKKQGTNTRCVVKWFGNVVHMNQKINFFHPSPIENNNTVDHQHLFYNIAKYIQRSANEHTTRIQRVFLQKKNKTQIKQKWLMKTTLSGNLSW